MFHQIYVPKRPIYHGIVVDAEAARADKLLRHFRYHRVFPRKKLLFREFVAKVNAGSWEEYLAK